jgi:hypothetical protein
MIDDDRGYPPNTIAYATVMGKPDVLCLRRKTAVGYDWAFSSDPENGLEYTCASDHENLVTNIQVFMWGQKDLDMSFINDGGKK